MVDQDEEREASLFAMELLMPAHFLEQDLEGKTLDIEGSPNSIYSRLDVVTAAELAAKYKVSVQLMTFRLCQLGYLKT